MAASSTSSSYFKEAWERIPRLQDHWAQIEQYRAHLPAAATPGGTLPEPLTDHIELVNRAAQRLITAHGLAPVFERLWDRLQQALDLSEATYPYLREMTMAVTAFHDYGKLNADFQAEKMASPGFHKQQPYMGTTHAPLSAYLFLNYYLRKLEQAGLPDDQVNKAGCVLAALADPILKHHNPQLTVSTLDEREDQEMSYYLPAVGLREPAGLWTAMKQHKVTIQTEPLSQSADPEAFPLFALMKLTFSLLTAADYQATLSYTYQQPLPAADQLDAYGLLSAEHKSHWIHAFKASAPYNAQAMEEPSALVKGQPEDYQQPGPSNLNQLRSLMLGESVQTIRQNPEQRLFYLKAPTGGGKTNISLAAALAMLNQDTRLNKVYYVFPFTTLITQTYQTVKEEMGLSDDEVVELHSRAPKRQAADRDDQYGQEWQNHVDYLFGNFPLTLLSHIRFFDILKNPAKTPNYLLHRLANAVVVIDELQSYPPTYWNHLHYFITQASYYFNIRFLIMSATLPEIGQLSQTGDPFLNLLQRPEAYLQNPNFNRRVSFDLTLTEREFRQEDEELTTLTSEVAERLNTYAAAHEGRVKGMIEFITKPSAAAFLQAAEQHAELADYTIMLLSGTILEPRRQAIISKLKDPEWCAAHPKVLLVCTQVVEAGVDVDMDLGFKDQALLDSDEQMAGRVNRNNLKEQAPVYLFQLDRTSKVYGNDTRLTNQRQLSRDKQKHILDEKAFDDYYQLVISHYRDDQQKVFSEWRSYSELFKELDFTKIDRDFQLIKDEAQAVFIPVRLSAEAFSPEEQHILRHHNLIQENEVDGCEVFELYKQTLTNREGDFIKDQERVKQLQSILANYVINVFPRIADRLYQQELENGLDDPVTGGFLYFSSYNETNPGYIHYDYYQGLIIPEASSFEIF